MPHPLHPRRLRDRALPSCARSACGPTSSTSTSACPRCRSTPGRAGSPTPTTPPLDMRMDPEQELTAEEIVNTWDERRLARLLREYGEERYAARSPARSSGRRSRGEVTSTQQLVETIKSAVPIPAQFAGGHPARRTFQALRIAVNDELTQLEEALPAGLGRARPRRPAGRDLLPLARGPDGQALPGRPGPGLHLPAGLPDLRVRPRARGRAAHPSCRGPHAGGGRGQPRSRSAHLRAARKLEVTPS